MMPYPASRGDADRAAKLQEESVLGAITLAGQKCAANDADPDAKDADAAAGDRPGEMTPVWKRYIDSRLKQFCTR